MKYRELTRLLKKMGFVSIGGKRHEIFEKDGRKIPIPRHKEIKENTAKEIIKQASEVDDNGTSKIFRKGH
ncbi:MAG: type II toxin-antitoxin system HicA family toxin [Deltaproteobacteria bacterium]|nr:type II toxin-antitoxin system HicA family toxin [Deltaproteobacteria bacterium]